MKSRLEKLFNLLQQLEVKADLNRITKNWGELPSGLRKVLDKTMNGGIPREDASYKISKIDGVMLCLAEYKDAANGFSASYLVYGKDVLYVNET